MKVKTKLRLGFGFLFLVVLIFGATALFYIREISKNSSVILKDNYESLNFTREMRKVLDKHELPLNATAISAFRAILVKQQANITEKGEQQATQHLADAFSQLTSDNSAAQQKTAAATIREDIAGIEILNMQAIVRKDNVARAAIADATLLLGLVGAFTFLVLFSFSVNFPGFIANPLRALLEGIREIGQGNYSKRLHFEQQDEFSEVANAFNQMATRLNEWENSNLATVLSEKRRIEAIIEQMQDAIFGLNEDGEVLFINDVARKMLNINDARVVGKNANELKRNNDLLTSILQDKPATGAFRIVIDDRESFFHLQSRDIFVPNTNPAKEGLRVSSRLAGKVFILRNITEFKERDEAKTNFIATISHELKTPISSIKMSLKLMNDERIGGMNHEQQQLLAHIADDNDRLLKITSELLELSQVETGNIQLNFVPVSPQEFVDYAVTSIKFQADQKQVELVQKLNGNLPAVNADIEKTAWVMVNFLSNALRYSVERSKIVISVTSAADTVTFAVQDFGKGIDAAYQKRLFDRYFQVPTDGQNKAGSGLGLAISKDFINAQGGQIGVESEIGAGSKFYFTLPAAAVSK